MKKCHLELRFVKSSYKISVQYRDDILKWGGIVLAEIDGQEYFLPAYIPYIGSGYFTEHKIGNRILAYALSQNLTKNDNWTKDWALAWHSGNSGIALDRQNYTYSKKSGRAAMHPFDTGHIPVLCVFVRSLVNKTVSSNSEYIYDEIAATNLSKFSFRENNKTTDNYESLRKCWEWLSKEEINLLRPDLILCVGNSVYNIVCEGVERIQIEGYSTPKVLKAVFPSLRVINRWFRKALTHEHLKCDEMIALLSENERGRLADVVRRDVYYFAEMYRRLEKQCTELRCKA